jgi:signal transduction histidine kinase
LKAELAHSRESLREFIAIAVHDFREPLRAIRAGADWLASQNGNEKGKAEVPLGLVNQGADRLEELIRDMAAYCNEEVREYECGDVPLATSVRSAQVQLAKEIESRGMVIAVDSLPVVEGDNLALTTVFEALLDNARKFHGGENPRVNIGAVLSGSEWVVSVRDDGAGFKREYAEQIFKPFQRLHSKQFPGSGLGLALARRIVERHGGRIWAESEPGQGTVVSFTLPAARQL